MKAFIRNFSRDIRVRFAPSPTGYLHLGGLRTALYNFLFAHSNNGKFILRVEDTDRTRLIPHAMEQLEYDLNWAGLTPDEGPSTGGKFGPYVQSQRSHIYRALGCEPPIFAHLPLILNADGTKLSKRQNDITVESMRSRGVFPRTLINFVIQAGGGFAEKVDPNSSIEHLITKFDLREVNKNSGKLPNDRLGEFNRLEIARMCKNKNELTTLANEIKAIVTNHFCERYTAEELDLNEEHVKSVLLWSLSRINYLHDLVGKNMEFLWVRPKLKQNEAGCDPEILNALEKELMKVEFTKEMLLPLLKSFSENNKISFKELMKALRMCLSGLKQGPGVAEMMEILGKSTSLKRLEEAKTSILSFK